MTLIKRFQPTYHQKVAQPRLSLVRLVPLTHNNLHPNISPASHRSLTKFYLALLLSTPTAQSPDANPHHLQLTPPSPLPPITLLLPGPVHGGEYHASH